MKRSGFKRKTQKQMKRSFLRKVSKDPRKAQLDRIQALLRTLAINRDGGCVLRWYPETGACNEVLQAEHLISRTNMNTYGDMRNIVCLCERHHIFWKPQNSDQYWELIREILGVERWAWYQLAKADKRGYKVDLTLVEIALQHDLQAYGIQM